LGGAADLAGGWGNRGGFGAGEVDNGAIERGVTLELLCCLGG
jgi:hypothetical protein